MMSFCRQNVRLAYTNLSLLSMMSLFVARQEKVNTHLLHRKFRLIFIYKICSIAHRKEHAVGRNSNINQIVYSTQVIFGYCQN